MACVCVLGSKGFGPVRPASRTFPSEDKVSASALAELVEIQRVYEERYE